MKVNIWYGNFVLTDDINHLKYGNRIRRDMYLRKLPRFAEVYHLIDFV